MDVPTVCLDLGHPHSLYASSFQQGQSPGRGRVPAGQADSCWPWPKADLSPEKAERKCCCSFCLEKHVPRAVAGSRHRTELKKDFRMGGIRIDCSILLSDLFILKDYICSVRSGDNYFLFTHRSPFCCSKGKWQVCHMFCGALSSAHQSVSSTRPDLLCCYCALPSTGAVQVCNKHLLNP